MKEFFLLEEDVQGELHLVDSCITSDVIHAYDVFTFRGYVTGDYVIGEAASEMITADDLYDYSAG